MPQKKPTGTIGVTRVSTGEPPVFVPTTFSETKETIERQILTGALECSTANGGSPFSLISPPIQNPQNDFDFTLPTSAGDEYLDLTELVFGMRGGHQQESVPLSVGEEVDAAWKLVEKKERRYGSRRNLNVHLMLYTTDWKFALSDSGIRLLTAYCKRRKQHFKTITYYEHSDPPTGGHLTRIFPSTADNTSELDEDNIRTRRVRRFDPRDIRVGPDGLSLTFEIP